MADRLAAKRVVLTQANAYMGPAISALFESEGARCNYLCRILRSRVSARWAALKPFETAVHFRVLDAFREHRIHLPCVLHRALDDG